MQEFKPLLFKGTKSIPDGEWTVVINGERPSGGRSKAGENENSSSSDSKHCRKTNRTVVTRIKGHQVYIKAAHIVYKYYYNHDTRIELLQ